MYKITIYQDKEETVLECRNSYEEETSKQVGEIMGISQVQQVRYRYVVQVVSDYVEKNHGDLDLRFNKEEFIMRGVFHNVVS